MSDNTESKKEYIQLRNYLLDNGDTIVQISLDRLLDLTGLSPRINHNFSELNGIAGYSVIAYSYQDRYIVFQKSE